ncbi:MAG: hypothetical protein ABL984_06255 [Pyrinomonadaceae bacterium]
MIRTLPSLSRVAGACVIRVARRHRHTASRIEDLGRCVAAAADDQDLAIRK